MPPDVVTSTNATHMCRLDNKASTTSGIRHRHLGRLGKETGSPESGRFQVDNREWDVTVIASVPSIEDR